MTRKRILTIIGIIGVVGILIYSIRVLNFQRNSINLTIYANPTSRQGVDTIYQVAQAIQSIPGSYNLSIYPPSESGDINQFLVEELEDLTQAEKEQILEEISFLQQIQNSHQTLLEYSTIRVDNIETTNWESLTKYSSSSIEEKKVQLNPPSDTTKTLLKNGSNILLINDQVFDIDNKKTVYQLEQKLIQLQLRKGSPSLNPPPNNPLVRLFFGQRYQRAGRFEAYTDLDCDDKTDQIGQVIGYKTPFQRCEYETPETIVFEVLTQSDTGKIDTELITVKNLLQQIFKKTEFQNARKISTEEVIEPPKTSQEQESIPFQILTDDQITQHPKFLELQEAGIIENIENRYFINIYTLI